ncbi:MAG: secondary thiamine-phosphate synthase enzyme YjbQ [Pseudomonadota bacterium]
MKIKHQIIELETGPGIALVNLMPQLREAVADSGIRHGLVAITSRHTTTALTINEDEKRLLEDIKTFFTRLVPPGDRYLHNDIALRDCPPDEPENAHSHIIALLLGASEVIALADGRLALGQWQSVLLVELDGPRRRTVSVQIIGE